MNQTNHILSKQNRLGLVKLVLSKSGGGGFTTTSCNCWIEQELLCVLGALQMNLDYEGKCARHLEVDKCIDIHLSAAP